MQVNMNTGGTCISIPPDHIINSNQTSTLIVDEPDYNYKMDQEPPVYVKYHYFQK